MNTIIYAVIITVSLLLGVWWKSLDSEMIWDDGYRFGREVGLLQAENDRKKMEE